MKTTKKQQKNKKDNTTGRTKEPEEKIAPQTKSTVDFKKNTGMSIAHVDDICDRRLLVVSRKC